MAQNRFPNSMAKFYDTRKAGSITIQGIELDTNEDGFVEAPANFAASMAPHGFMQEGTPEANEFAKRHQRAKQGK